MLQLGFQAEGLNPKLHAPASCSGRGDGGDVARDFEHSLGLRTIVDTFAAVTMSHLVENLILQNTRHTLRPLDALSTDWARRSEAG